MIMSSTLVYEPYSPDEGVSLQNDLKHVISRKYWGTDGSCGDSAILDEKDIPYLEGVRDSGVNGSSQLIDAIRAHGKVRIWHTY